MRATPVVSKHKQLWDTEGWCVVEDVIPPDDLAKAQEALGRLFPTAEEFATQREADQNPSFSSWEAAKPRFPFESGALNRLVVHDAMIDLAEELLETEDVRVYQGIASAKYSDAAPDYEQLLHADYGNHTLVVPRHDAGYEQLETFIYLSDVTPETAATRMVPLPLTDGIPVERTYLHLEEYAHLYGAEVPASGPAGSVLVYRPDVYHRGTALTEARSARFMLHVAYKVAGRDWLGYQSWPAQAEDPGWNRFMKHATLRQLTVLGFPKPGDNYWTKATLDGVAARYPFLDMSPWRAVLS